MPDDHTADAHTTCMVTVGGSAAGTFETSGDRDEIGTYTPSVSHVAARSAPPGAESPPRQHRSRGRARRHGAAPSAVRRIVRRYRRGSGRAA